MMVMLALEARCNIVNSVCSLGSRSKKSNTGLYTSEPVASSAIISSPSRRSRIDVGPCLVWTWVSPWKHPPERLASDFSVICEERERGRECVSSEKEIAQKQRLVESHKNSLLASLSEKERRKAIKVHTYTYSESVKVKLERRTRRSLLALFLFSSG